jgi:outer membrane receptor protein involved in Fe transport
MATRYSWVLVLLVASALPCAAQETTTGSISGRIVDAQGLAVPGVTVTITGPQGARSFVTDGAGRFYAPFLTPGTYTVAGELQGFKRVEQQNIAVRLGQQVDLQFTMQVGGLTETVEVTGGSPVVDMSTTTVGATLDEELLRAVPIGRRFSDTLFIVPGVSSGGGTGDANPSVSGGSGLENQYIVDGINISSSGFGALGSYSIVFGSLGNGLPFDFMKEVQVKTAGYEPEFGASTGGVTNVITKSGSNELRGTGFGYVRPEQLERDWNQITTINGTVNTTETRLWDAGAEAGAPIVRNKVFIFGAIDRVFERRTFIAPEDFPLRRLGEVARDREILNYAVKGTWQIAGGHRIDGSVFGDPANGDNGPQRASALLRQDISAFSELQEYGGHNQTVRYDGVLSPRWLLEGSIARSQNDIIEIPSVNDWSVEDRTVTPNIRTGGIGFFEQALDDRNLQYSAKSTHILEAGGNHQVRYGITFEDIAYDSTINRTGPSFTLPNGVQTVTGANVQVLPDDTFGRIFRVTRANTSNVRDSRQDYLSLFAQDTWRIRDRLTVTGGVRWDRQKLIGNLADFTWDENIAPRIGATFDPLGTGRMKVFGNWGRFYAKIPNDLAVRALSADAGVTRADYFDASLTRPIPEGVLAAGATRHFIQAGLEASEFDPDMNGTSLDEVVVGAEFEALEGLNVGVRYINRRFNEIVEDIGTAPVAAFLTNQAGDVEFFITNPSPATPVILPQFGASHEDPIHDYDAVEVHADKRFGDNWSLQSSYRWSRLEGTFEGFFRNDNGQSDPAITSLFDFPTNDPSYTAIAVPQFGARGDIRFLGAAGQGPLPNDRRHQFKVFGNYNFDFGLNLGVGLITNSGQPLTALAAHPVYENGGEIPEGPRGSGFETVDGFRTRTATEFTVDLHGDYAFRLGTGQRIVVLADVFNLFDNDQVVAYDDRTELTVVTPNPDFGARLRFQPPLQVRIGARFEF